MNLFKSRWLLAMVLLLLYSSTTLAQTTQKVSLNLKQVSLQDVFSAIEQQTSYRFSYRDVVINKIKDVSALQQGVPVQVVLDAILPERMLQYYIASNKSIVISKTPEKKKQENNKKKQVTGVVKDERGEFIIGATVKEKGILNGTVTGIDGHFMLETAPEAVLEISFIGYKHQQIKVAHGISVAITLKEDTEVLDEVVVVGYGVVKKSDLTGSVGSIKSDVISKMPVASVDQALQGRISGVQITTTNGAPGESTTIRVRGGNSINAGNEPLYVIDGIIGGGNLTSINPSDIASVEVLKDASSTAIYGSRGANGVILITTKRGEGTEGTRLSYDGYYGIQTPIKQLDLLNGLEAAVYQNDLAEYDERDPVFIDMGAIGNTKWNDYIFRKSAPITNHNLSVSNATKDGNFFLSLNYFNQEGIMYESGFERYQIRYNMDRNIGNLFKIGATLTSSMTNRDNPVVGGISLLPTAPVYKEDGSYFDINQVSGNVYNNPIAQRNGILNKTRLFRGVGSVYGQLTLFKNLILRSSLGFDISHSKQNKYQSVTLPSNIFDKSGGHAEVGTNFPISYQNENTINYILNWKEHSLAVLGGFTWQKYQKETLKSIASGFKNDANQYHAMEAGDPATRNIQTGEEEWGLMSYLFRVNYSFRNRYMFTASGREDGSSRLAKENQWAFFPSAAIAWRASEEMFVKNLNIFSNLKLRLTYGTSGSQSIDPYSIKDRLISGSNVIGNEEVITYTPGLSANKKLGWEKTSQIDFGMEMGFLNNRLTLDFDYYYKRTKDLLLEKELPYQTGFTTILENVGEIENQGFEITVNSVNFDARNFSWKTNVSVSLNRNKVLNLGGKEFIENGKGTRLMVGQPIGVFYGVKSLGTWKEGEIPEGKSLVPGDSKWDDLDKNYIIDVNDGQIIGNAEPQFYGGIGNDFTYKRFTFGLFFDFSYGNDIFDLGGREMESGFNVNVYGHNRGRWTPGNSSSEIPRAGSLRRLVLPTYAAGAQGGYSLFVHDGSFLRLKNINLQYDIPLKSKKYIKSLQVYGTATNVFTWTPYFGYSPDVSSEESGTRRGFDNNVYPQSRTYLIGLKANF